ncbi:MAG: hypothetical protein Fues2KO_03670 [Fuerstiella sp.]
MIRCRELCENQPTDNAAALQTHRRMSKIATAAVRLANGVHWVSRLSQADPMSLPPVPFNIHHLPYHDGVPHGY